MIPSPMNRPGAGSVDITPGVLADTLDPVAIGTGRAAYNRNCRTGRGIWELSPRHRRFKSNPTREYAESGAFCTDFTIGEATVSNVGSGAEFSSLSSLATQDGVGAFAQFDYGTSPVTKTLRTYGMLPSSTIPTGSTITDFKIKVRRRKTGDLTVTETTVQPRANGANLGTNRSTSYALTSEWAETTFLASSLPSVAQINGALCGVDLLYTMETWLEAWDDPANYTITVTNSGSAVMMITVTYIGPGTKPTKAYVSVTSMAAVTAVGGGLASLDFTASGTLNSGLDTASISLYRSGLAGSDSADDVTYAENTDTWRVTIPLTSGTGSVDITRAVSTTLLTGTGWTFNASYSGSATLSPPTLSSVEVDIVHVSYCASGTTVIKTGAAAIQYGDFSGQKEIGVLWGQSEFFTDASDADAAISVDWTGPTYSGLLGTGSWSAWQYGKWLWYTNSDAGVYYREIGESVLNTLSRDYSFQGNASIRTDYLADRDWDSVRDPLTLTDDAPVLDATTNAVVDGEYRITGTTDDQGRDGNITVEANWTTAEDWTSAGYIEIEIVCGSGTVEFYKDSRSIEILWSTTSGGSYSWTALDTKQFASGSYSTLNFKKSFIAYVRGVTARANSIFVKGIRFSMSSYIIESALANVLFTMKPIRFGGAKLNAAASTERIWDTGITGTEIEYACRYKKISTSEVSAADIAKTATSLSIGDKWYSYSSNRGGRVAVRSSFTNQSPFLEDTSGTPNIVIQFMRKDSGGKWRLLGEKGNTGTQVFYDDYQEHELSSLTEITDFSIDVDETVFGKVTGITTGCAWKGSNVYAGTNGKIYFSRSNDAKDVLWDGVVETNEVEIGLAKTEPRTDVLADNTVDPALALVPTENLYALTAREVYVFVSGETPATASFPRRIDQARGVVGTKAAIAYRDACLYASTRGLEIVKKASDVGDQPDSLQTLTADIDSTWAWLLGDSPETTIVQVWADDVWVLNESRALWLRAGESWVPIEWHDLREAVDATVDPVRGVFVLWSDGHVSRLGSYITDGGSDVDGTNGTAPSWAYISGSDVSESFIHRTRATLTGEIVVTLVSDTGQREVVVQSTLEDTLQPVVEHDTSTKRLHRSRLSLEIEGSNESSLKALSLLQAQRSRSRTPSY